MNRCVAFFAVFAAGVLALAPHADAQNERGASILWFDVNDFTVAHQGPLNVTFSGPINFHFDDDTVLPMILKDGSFLPLDAIIDAMSGRIDFINGSVEGGYIAIVLVANEETLVYSAEVVDGPGGLSSQAGQGFTIQFETTNGVLTRPGIGVTNFPEFYSNVPLNGSALAFAINTVRLSGNDYADDDVDLDLFMIEPMSTLPPDLNGDGVIDASDLAILLAAWGPLP